MVLIGAGSVTEMPDVTQHLARALISAHGDEAVAHAQQAMQNVMGLQMLDKVAEWQRVIDAIKEIQAAKR
jgi:hypothetical protein